MIDIDVRRVVKSPMMMLAVALDLQKSDHMVFRNRFTWEDWL